MGLAITNATVVTGDSQGTIFRDGAVAVEKDRIAAIGPAQEVQRRFPDAEALDARGCAIFPGLVNLHTHLVLTSLRGVVEDVPSPFSVYGYMVPMQAIMSAEERAVFAALGCLEAIRSGTTLLLDNWNNVLDYVPTIAPSGVRLVLSELISDADLLQVHRDTYQFSQRIGQESLQRGVDLVEGWQGKEEGRVRCQLSAHAPDTCSPWLLGQVRELVERHGVGYTVHLAQSRPEQEVVQRLRDVRSVVYLQQEEFLGPGLVAAHCLHLDEKEIDILGRSGTHISHNPGINARRGFIAPVMELRDQGANIGMGSDNMSENMVDVLRLGLITNRIRRGTDTDPQPEDVLEWATLGGARALGLERELGSLEEGKKADLFVVDLRRPHLVPAVDVVGTFIHNGQTGDITHVMVDGRWLLQDGQVTTLDEEDILARAQDVGVRLWERFAETYPHIPIPFQR